MLNKLDPATLSKARKLAQREDLKDKTPKWPTKEHMRSIVDAVDADTDHVFLGRKMYGMTFDRSNRDRLFIKPLDGSQVPCGWFRLSEMRRELAYGD